MIQCIFLDKFNINLDAIAYLIYYSLLIQYIHNTTDPPRFALISKYSAVGYEIAVTWIGMLIFATSARNVPYDLPYQKNVIDIFYFKDKGHFVTFKDQSYNTRSVVKNLF